MTPERLASFLKANYPDLLPEVIDMYEKHYKSLPWSKDPVRGGYHFMATDLKFLNDVSLSIKIYKRAARLNNNGEVDAIARPKTPAPADPLEPVFPAPATHDMQAKLIEYATTHRPKAEQIYPPVQSQAKLDRDAPIMPPTKGKADFANLEVKIKAGGATATMQVDQSAKTLDEALAPLTTEISGETNHNVKAAEPNQTAAMADLEKRKQELKNARAVAD